MLEINVSQTLCGLLEVCLVEHTFIDCCDLEADGQEMVLCKNQIGVCIVGVGCLGWTSGIQTLTAGVPSNKMFNRRYRLLSTKGMRTKVGGRIFCTTSPEHSSDALLPEVITAMGWV